MEGRVGVAQLMRLEVVDEAVNDDGPCQATIRAGSPHVADDREGENSRGRVVNVDVSIRASCIEFWIWTI